MACSPCDMLLLLAQVSKWLGVSAEDVLEEADAENEKLFDKPRPNL